MHFRYLHVSLISLCYFFIFFKIVYFCTNCSFLRNLIILAHNGISCFFFVFIIFLHFWHPFICNSGYYTLSFNFIFFFIFLKFDHLNAFLSVWCNLVIFDKFFTTAYFSHFWHFFASSHIFSTLSHFSEFWYIFYTYTYFRHC